MVFTECVKPKHINLLPKFPVLNTVLLAFSNTTASGVDKVLVPQRKSFVVHKWLVVVSDLFNRVQRQENRDDTDDS